jgi:hypothetical protein
LWALPAGPVDPRQTSVKHATDTQLHTTPPPHMCRYLQSNLLAEISDLAIGLHLVKVRALQTAVVHFFGDHDVPGDLHSRTTRLRAIERSSNPGAFCARNLQMSGMTVARQVSPPRQDSPGRRPSSPGRRRPGLCFSRCESLSASSVFDRGSSPRYPCLPRPPYNPPPGGHFSSVCWRWESCRLSTTAIHGVPSSAVKTMSNNRLSDE